MSKIISDEQLLKMCKNKIDELYADDDLRLFAYEKMGFDEDTLFE